MAFEYAWVIFFGLIGLSALLMPVVVWGIRRGHYSGWGIFFRIVATLGCLIIALISYGALNFSPCGPGMLERVIQHIKYR
jgi:hypothetical protein